MIWLEMSRDEEHGGTGWGFTECLWSPTIKKNGARWPYWGATGQVRRGDVILHLRGRTHNAFFVGHSIASNDGHETQKRPPSPGEWAFATTFYRTDLAGFERFEQPIKLDDVFSE